MPRALRTLLVSIQLCCATFFAAELRAQDEDKPRDIRTLIKELESADPAIQEDALSDLHYVGVAALPAVSALAKIVAGPNAENRQTALEILGGIGPKATAAEPAIADLLDGSKVGVRMLAAEALLRITPDHAGAIATLGAALRSNEVEQRRAAARTIAWLGRNARGSEPALIAAADDKDEEVRSATAEALGSLGPGPRERALPPLREMLADESPTVRVAAASALWRLEEPAEAVLPTFTQVLKEFQPGKEVRPAWQVTNDHLPSTQAATALGEMGPDARGAIEDLITACDQSHAGLRLAAIDALGEIGPESRPAIDRLTKALRETEVYALPFVHRSWCVSDQAAIALRKIGPASREVLIAALRDKDERVRINAADALGQLQPGTEETVAALIKLLDAPEAPVRATAAFSLGRLGTLAAPAGPKLSALLNDESEWKSFPASGGIGARFTLGDHVLIALKEIGAESKTVVPEIIESLQKERRISQATVEVLRRFGPQAVDAVPALEPLLRDPKQRLPSAQAMARIAPDHDGLLEIFRAALVDREQNTAVPAARGLGDLDRRARAALPQLLAELDRENDPSGKSILAAAIVRIDPKQAKAVVELARGLRETPERFRYAGHDDAAATWVALGKDAQPGMELLVSGLHYEVTDPTVRVFDKIRHEANVRLRSAELLVDVSLRTQEAVAGLVQLCESTDCSVRGGAADALAKLGSAANGAVPALVVILPDDELYVVGGDSYGNGGTRNYPGEHAARALAAIGEPAIPALLAALKDEEPATRERAALALGLIGPRAVAAEGELKQAMQDHSRAVRRAAGNALKKIATP